MKTHVFVILDRSGSMSSCQDATIKGYNEYLEGMKGEKDVRWNLVLFDDRLEHPVDDQPVAAVKKLTPKTFVPRGSTALRDAVCRTLNQAKSTITKKDRALVVIITDGYENASREYSAEQMRDLIKELEGHKNWTFTYLGANQDAWQVAQSYGFARGNTVSYNQTERGTQETFTQVRAASVNLAQSDWMAMGAASGPAFYSAEQKKKIEETK